MSDRRSALAKFENLLALYGIERSKPGDELAELQRRVLRQVDVVRRLHRSRVGRLSAAEKIEGLVNKLLGDVLRDAADTDLVFRTLESLRARTLLDQMTLGADSFSAPEGAQRAAALERQAMSFEPPAAGESDRDRGYQLGSTLPLAQPELVDELETLFEASRGGSVSGQEVVSHADVVAALGPDEVLVEYCLPAPPRVPARELWALVVTREKTSRLQLMRSPISSEMSIAIDGRAPVDFFVLNQAVAELNVAVRTSDRAAPARLSAMHDLLVGPLRETGIDPQVFKHWIIVPDDTLHAVPFAALRSPAGKFLGEEAALSVVPSASIWLQLLRSPPPLRSFLGLANPDVAGMSALPHAERELHEVCRLLRNRGVVCEGHVGAQATESRLKQRAPGRGVVHVAAHGRFPTAEALDLHELMLACGSDDDGRVRAHEFRQLDLKAAALAVLSVCDSGTYRFGPGNELHGLVAALLVAGARDVVATLWPIDDLMGSRLIVQFYTYLIRHGAAEALRRARIDLIRQGANVRDWAAFVVVGPGRSGKG